MYINTHIYIIYAWLFLSPYLHTFVHIIIYIYIYINIHRYISTQSIPSIRGLDNPDKSTQCCRYILIYLIVFIYSVISHILNIYNHILNLYLYITYIKHYINYDISIATLLLVLVYPYILLEFNATNYIYYIRIYML